MNGEPFFSAEIVLKNSKTNPFCFKYDKFFLLMVFHFFSDNQIYSWGRGDNGRLGVLTDSLMRAKGGIPCTAVPRPIFGALHVLSCVACRHWNSLIVAERVLSSRAVKRAGLSGRSLESQSCTYTVNLLLVLFVCLFVCLLYNFEKYKGKHGTRLVSNYEMSRNVSVSF